MKEPLSALIIREKWFCTQIRGSLREWALLQFIFELAIYISATCNNYGSQFHMKDVESSCSILYYLCAESTATGPITDTAQYRYT
jgi:hypothetical protein